MSKETQRPEPTRSHSMPRKLLERIGEMSPLEQMLWAVGGVLAIVALIVYTSPRPIDGSAVAAPAPLAYPSARVTATRSAPPTPIPSRTPVGGLSFASADPLIIPTPPPNGVLLTFSPNLDHTGWIGSKELGPHWRDRNLHSGIYQGQELVALIQFDVATLAPGSRILYAAVELSGRNSRYLGTAGEWKVELINPPGVLRWDDLTYDAARQVPSLTTLGDHLAARQLGQSQVNDIVLTPSEMRLLERQIDTGEVTVRLSGPSDGKDNLFTWEAGPGIGEPTLYVVAVPSSFVVITVTPTSADVFAAATMVARQTEQVRLYGTPTPFPRSVATATPGATSIALVTGVPTPESAATATARSAYATAVAATTGTFTPTPRNWVTPTSTPTLILLIPKESLTPIPTPTVAPTRLGAVELAKMPLPRSLYNKIAFLEGPRTDPRAWIMDPDGTHWALLTNRQVYDIAKARDQVSPDGTTFVYQALDQNGYMQLWGKNLNFPDALPQQLTYARGSVVYGQAWSPDGKKITYVSDELWGQEIWILTLEPKDWKRLTVANGIDWWYNQYPSWSPDGRQIVFSSDRGHNGTFSEIWVMNADGSNPRNLGNGSWDAYNPVWIKWQQ